MRDVGSNTIRTTHETSQVLHEFARFSSHLIQSTEALPGVLGIQEKGYLFSGIWGEGPFIFRDLGSLLSLREQGAGG